MRKIAAILLALTLTSNASHIHNPSGGQCLGGLIHPPTSNVVYYAPALDPAPTVSSVSPTAGALAGGTSLTINGTGFLSGATSTVGGTACTSPNVASSISMSCTLPAKSAGAYTVAVLNTDGQSGSLSNAYTYQAAPTVASVSPTSGSTAGSTAITITGTGFLSGATATVGGVSCTSPNVTNSTTMTCTTGARAAATVDIVVTNSDTQSGTGSNLYTYATPFADATSIDCDGTNDYGSVAGTTVNGYFEYNTPFSFSIWVKPDAVTGEKTFFSTRDSGASYRGFLVEALNAGFLGQLNTNALQPTLQSASAFASNTWAHIVIVYSGASNFSGYKFYLNGTDTATGSSTAYAATTVTSVNAQFCNDPQSSYFNGKIGDSAVFNVALTSGQVTEIYNSGNGIDMTTVSVASNVKHWWQMGDGAGDTGTTVVDQIGSADITLTNGAAFISDAP